MGCQIGIRRADGISRHAGPAASPDNLVLLGQDETGYRNLLAFSSDAFLQTDGHEAAQLDFDALEGHSDGLIAFAGALDGAVGRLLAEGQADAARAPARTPGGPVSRPALRRNPAPRARGRASDRSRFARPCLCAGFAAGRDQRCLFRRRRHVRGARRVALHRARRIPDDPRAPAADARASLQKRCRDARPVRRPARSGRQHIGDCPALRLSGGRTGAHIAGLSGRRRRCKRDQRVARRGRGGAGGASRTPGLSCADGWGGARNCGGALPGAAGLRARRHRGDEVSRLFPDRGRLYPMGEARRNSGRTGARLGRRFGGGLGVADHRPGSPAFRPAVRAVSKSRADLDAGLRRRFLPGPARRGDRLCARQIRRRPGGADHHLREAPGARRVARRRPGARDALFPGRPAVQAGAQQSGQAGYPRRGAGGGSRAAGNARGRPDRRAAARLRVKAGGALPSRFDPRRRRGDRRPAAPGAGAALSRSPLRPAGDPVFHEIRRSRRVGEVRLPGAQDPDRPGPGLRSGPRARRCDRSRDPGVRRRAPPIRCWGAAPR